MRIISFLSQFKEIVDENKNKIILLKIKNKFVNINEFCDIIFNYISDNKLELKKINYDELGLIKTNKEFYIFKKNILNKLKNKNNSFIKIYASFPIINLTLKRTALNFLFSIFWVRPIKETMIIFYKSIYLNFLIKKNKFNQSDKPSYIPQLHISKNKKGEIRQYNINGMISLMLKLKFLLAFLFITKFRKKPNLIKNKKQPKSTIKTLYDLRNAKTFKNNMKEFNLIRKKLLKEIRYWDKIKKIIFWLIWIIILIDTYLFIYNPTLEINQILLFIILILSFCFFAARYIYKNIILIESHFYKFMIKKIKEDEKLRIEN